MEKTDSGWKDEADVLRHLLDVENDAASLALEASEEADKRRSSAKQKADAKYRVKYEELIASLDSWLNSEKESCDAALKATFSEYDERLKAMPKNLDAFYSFVDSVLIGN